jgi:NAD(P)-dependent dehydrogenase (short-subunit alcohol dehydrogenase family)
VNNNQVSKDGFEIHCAVNHLGHFLLTNVLLENIKNNNSKVVTVSSKLHEQGVIDFKNFGKFVETPEKIRKRNFYYNNSKLMNFYFAKELYKRGIDSVSCCPGLCWTNLFRDFKPKFYHYILFSPIALLFLRSAKQGAQNIIHCAINDVNTSEKNPDKSFIVINLKQQKSKVNLQDEISSKLWIESAKLCELN